MYYYYRITGELMAEVNKMLLVVSHGGSINSPILVSEKMLQVLLDTDKTVKYLTEEEYKEITGTKYIAGRKGEKQRKENMQNECN
jgi:hypothetical protein